MHRKKPFTTILFYEYKNLRTINLYCIQQKKLLTKLVFKFLVQALFETTRFFFRNIYLKSLFFCNQLAQERQLLNKHFSHLFKKEQGHLLPLPGVVGFLSVFFHLQPCRLPIPPLFFQTKEFLWEKF